MHPSATTLLLEYDQRFAIAAASSGGGHFVHYDLEEDKIPDAIKGTVELAILDPPFLNEVRLELCNYCLLECAEGLSIHRSQTITVHGH